MVEMELLPSLSAVRIGSDHFKLRPQEFIVLAHLHRNLGEDCPVGDLIQQVWPRTPPASAKNIIQQIISGIRKRIAGSAYWIWSREDSYQLRQQ